MKKLTWEQIIKLNGRHVSGAIHFNDGTFITVINNSVSQVRSYIRTNGKEFAYFIMK